MESELGQGSSFQFTAHFGLRKVQPRQPAETAPTEATEQINVSGETKRRLRILLAEDNRINQQFAVRALSKQGHEVSVANNGTEAVEAWEKGSFDAVLMDVQMPGVDGYKATERIRRIETAKGPRTLIIAMTAHAMRGDRDRCIESGMDGYMTKPINGPQLIEYIEHILDETGNR